MTIHDPLPKYRFFIQEPLQGLCSSNGLSEALALPIEIVLTDEFTVHHAKAVLRLKPGDQMTGINPIQQKAYRAEIIGFEQQGSSKVETMRVRLTESIDMPQSDLPTVTLAAALIKEQRWDVLIQKATELGVSSIIPLESRFTVIHISTEKQTKKQTRWQDVLKAAALQSQGLFIPVIQPVQTLKLFLSAESQQALSADLKLLFLEWGDDRPPFKQVLRPVLEQYKREQVQGEQNSLSNLNIQIAIGPEGGWSADEVEAFKAAGYQSVSLGQRILKSETAALAVLSMISYECAT